MDRTLGIVALALALSSAPVRADPPIDEDLRELGERIAAHPEDVDALIERSELSARAGLGDDALDDLRLALALAPGDPRIPLARASALHLVRRDDEALAELDALIAVRPTMSAHALRARVLVALDRVADSIDAYDDALALGPDVDLYLERGRLLEQLGRAEEAALGYHAGLASTGAIVLREAAIAVDLRIGHPDRALATIDEVLPTLAVRGRWLLLRARALEALGRAADARRDRTTALGEIDARLARRPTAALHVERGEALFALGRVEEARAAAARARSLAPRLASAIDLELRARAAGGAR